MSRVSSPLGLAGILFIIIGVIMAIIGVILLVVNQNNPSLWYIWLLLIGGIVFGVAGGVMLAIALASPVPQTYQNCTPCPAPLLPQQQNCNIPQFVQPTCAIP